MDTCLKRRDQECFIDAYLLFGGSVSIGSRIFLIFVTEMKLCLHLLYCLFHETQEYFRISKSQVFSEHQALALLPKRHKYLYASYISGAVLSASLYHRP